MTAFVTVNGPYIRTLGLSINIASFLFTSFWCYWGLQIWSNPSAFSFPGRISTLSAQFVVFGKSVSPTSPGMRGVTIFIFAVGAIAALSALRWRVYWALMYASGHAGEAKESAAMDLARKRDEWRQSVGGIGMKHITPFGGMVGMIYMIVTTEHIAGRNMAPSSQAGSFSQTMALVMIAQQVMDCWHYLKQELIYMRQRAKRSGITEP